MKSTLYYNGACPLCRAEMTRLSRCQGAPRLCDISRLSVEQLPLPREVLLAELHLQNPDGSWTRGLDANLAVWHASGARFWPRVVGHPWIKPLAAWSYRQWARWHQRRFRSLR